MNAKFVLSPKARADVDRIWSDTARVWGEDQAETYIRQLRRHIELVAAAPAIGRGCPEIRTGYRKYPPGSHILFYRLVDDRIDIVRILHERMDFRQLF